MYQSFVRSHDRSVAYAARNSPAMARSDGVRGRGRRTQPEDTLLTSSVGLGVRGIGTLRAVLAHHGVGVDASFSDAGQPGQSLAHSYPTYGTPTHRCS